MTTQQFKTEARALHLGLTLSLGLVGCLNVPENFSSITPGEYESKNDSLILHFSLRQNESFTWRLQVNGSVQEEQQGTWRYDRVSNNIWVEGRLRLFGVSDLLFSADTFSTTSLGDKSLAIVDAVQDSFTVYNDTESDSLGNDGHGGIAVLFLLIPSLTTYHRL